MGKDIDGAIKDLDSGRRQWLQIDAVYTLRAQLRKDLGDLKGAIADLDETIRSILIQPTLILHSLRLAFKIGRKGSRVG